MPSSVLLLVAPHPLPQCLAMEHNLLHKHLCLGTQEHRDIGTASLGAVGLKYRGDRHTHAGGQPRAG